MRKIKETEEGIARGYRRIESGCLEIIDLPVIDGQVVDGYGLPYSLDGDVVELMGWPDDYAVEVQSNLLVAVE